MQASPRPPAIGILGHYGNANLGDEAIIHAVLAAVRRRWPQGPVYAISNRPADSAGRHGVPSISILTGELEAPGPDPAAPVAHQASPAGPPAAERGTRRESPGWPWQQPLLRAARGLAGQIVRGSVWAAREAVFCARTFRRVRRLDLLLIAGSNQLADNFGGPLEFPYINFRWSVLARLAGCRVVWVSVGAGPLTSPMGRRFARSALRIADYVSVRDEGSRQLLREIGVTRNIRLFPDLAHGLDRGHVTPGQRSRDGLSRGVVAINPMPIFDARYWPERVPEKYARYASELAAFAAALIKEGFDVFFFSTQPRDTQVAGDVLAVMDREHGVRLPAGELVRASATVPELLDVIASADFVVPTRFHGALLSLLVERPTLAICYYRKTRELMIEFGQGEELAVAIEEFRAGDAVARVLSLEGRAAELTALMRQKNAEHQAALAQQYDLVFGLLSGSTPGAPVTSAASR